MPLTAQPTLRINKKFDFENEISSIFSMIHLFFSHYVRKKNNREKNRENMLNYGAKDRGDLKLHFSAINSTSNFQHQQENRLYLRLQN